MARLCTLADPGRPLVTGQFPRVRSPEDRTRGGRRGCPPARSSVLDGERLRGGEH